MLQKTSYLAFAAITVLAFPFSGQAASEGRSETEAAPRVRMIGDGSINPRVGLQAGYMGVDDQVSTQDAAFSFEVGIEPVPKVETTLQAQYTPGSVKPAGRGSGGPKANFNVTNALLKVAYTFGGDIPVIRNTFVGAKSGAVFNTLENDTTSYFGVGGTAGFDIPVDVANSFTVGAEATYLGVIGDNTPDQASALGSMKYWF